MALHRVRPDPHRHSGGRRAHDMPRLPAEETMDGAVLLGLGECHVVLDAVEAVLPVGQAVGPGDERSPQAPSNMESNGYGSKMNRPPILQRRIPPPTSTTVARLSLQATSTWQPDGQVSNVAPLLPAVFRAQRSGPAARVWSNDVVDWATDLSRNYCPPSYYRW
jgi:hypothetical protein